MWSTLLNRLQRFSILSLDRRPRLTSMIAQEVGKGAAVVLFYADIVKMTAIENRYGDTAAKRVLHIFERTLPEVCRDVFEIKGKVLAIQRLWGDDFAVYVSFSSGFQEEECRLMSISFQERMEMQVNRQVRFVHREDLRVHIGYARFPGVDVVKEMYTSVKHAVHMAKYGVTSEKYTHVTQFHRLLQDENIDMHYMPIVSLRDAEPLGWEALARGPQNTPFYSPAALFSYAEETDMVFRLEHICRKRALEQLRYLKTSQKLFINIDPRAIDDPYLLRGDVLGLLERYRLNPRNIVLGPGIPASSPSRRFTPTTSNWTCRSFATLMWIRSSRRCWRHSSSSPKRSSARSSPKGSRPNGSWKR